MSASGLSELERAWAVLGRPRIEEFVSFPLTLVFGGEVCRAAVDRSGARHLLIPVDGEHLMVDPRPSVLGTSVRRLGFGGAVATYVDVTCADGELFEEFNEVLSDVLDTIEGSPRPGAEAIEAVGRWRRLFRSALARGLTRPAKLGLFAELTVLGALLAAAPDLPIEAWRGPLGAPHDFEAPARCLEVKGLGSETDSIVVHGLAQLDNHDKRPLELVLVRVVDDPDGRTVGDLAQELPIQAKDRSRFKSLLAAAGWHSDLDRPDGDTFAVGEKFIVPVTDGVPRLVASSLTEGRLPEGVGRLQYQLELTSLLPHVTKASLNEIAVESTR
ncbi:PD-(D/E)XK motif protein [Actinoplanes sp. NPDC051861]|uniref:PD-(D/E)XK motif protein n=1 Tax=Actinoplanes sp. NPDC051861 TaxID=3155170 RepID=UPI0034319E80